MNTQKHTDQHTNTHTGIQVFASVACMSIDVRACMLFCNDYINTGWWRPIGCLKLQVIFRKRVTNCRALLRKITYEQEAPSVTTPPCMCMCTYKSNVCLYVESRHTSRHITHVSTCTHTHTHTHTHMYARAHAQTHIHTPAHTCTLVYTHARIRTHKIFLAHTYTLSLSHIINLSLLHTHILTRTHTHTQTDAHIHTHTLTFGYLRGLGVATLLLCVCV